MSKVADLNIFYNIHKRQLYLCHTTWRLEATGWSSVHHIPWWWEKDCLHLPLTSSVWTVVRWHELEEPHSKVTSNCKITWGSIEDGRIWDRFFLFPQQEMASTLETSINDREEDKYRITFLYDSCSNITATLLWSSILALRKVFCVLAVLRTCLQN